MIKVKGRQLEFTGEDAVKIRRYAKEFKMSVKDLVHDALSRGFGFANYKDFKEFYKAEVDYEFDIDGSSCVGVPDCLGEGAHDQLTAQMLELDEV